MCVARAFEQNSGLRSGCWSIDSFLGGSDPVKCGWLAKIIHPEHVVDVRAVYGLWSFIANPITVIDIVNNDG